MNASFLQARVIGDYVRCQMPRVRCDRWRNTPGNEPLARSAGMPEHASPPPHPFTPLNHLILTESVPATFLYICLGPIRADRCILLACVFKRGFAAILRGKLRLMSIIQEKYFVQSCCYPYQRLVACIEQVARWALDWECSKSGKVMP